MRPSGDDDSSAGRGKGASSQDDDSPDKTAHSDDGHGADDFMDWADMGGDTSGNSTEKAKSWDEVSDDESFMGDASDGAGDDSWVSQTEDDNGKGHGGNEYESLVEDSDTLEAPEDGGGDSGVDDSPNNDDWQ